MKRTIPNFQEIQKRHSRRRLIIKFSIFVAFFGLLTFGAIRIIFYSSLFKFNNLVVRNLEDSSKQESLLSFLKARIETGPFLKRALGFNSFLAWPNQISGQEVAFLVGIKRLEIEKSYRDRALTVSAIEQEPFGVWCLSKTFPPKCFWFNDQGFAFKEAPVTSGNLIYTISDFYQDGLEINSRVLPEEFRANLISVLRILSLLELDSREIIVRDLTLQEIEIVSVGGPKIYFSLRHNAKSYLGPLKSLIADPKFSKLEYVDLRVENRVYYQ